MSSLQGSQGPSVLCLCTRMGGFVLLLQGICKSWRCSKLAASACMQLEWLRLCLQQCKGCIFEHEQAKL